MRPAAVVAWVLSVCTGLRRSQAKTLAALAAAAVRVGRVSLAALGRQMSGPALCKHKLKRAWRFCANPRVTVADGMRGVIERLGRRRDEPLLVALDWVEVRTFHTLMAAAVCGGRALPLLWASYAEWELYKSQNDLEEGLLRLLRSLVPARVELIVLADRGFGRAELARTCAGLPELHFLLRVKPDVGVRHPRYAGLLRDYPVRPGIGRVLRQAQYRLGDPVTLNVVIRWKKGLPPGRDEPWFLITDLPGTAAALTALYARRMAVEELFRDDKSLRNGWALRLTQLTKPGRFDRLLLVLALAYWLLVGLGLLARSNYRPAFWCSTNRERAGRWQCSAFTIGRAVCARLRERPSAAFQACCTATAKAVANWG
jgi:Transposase DDE domain